MTAHDHAAFVEGCFRCDLSRGEAVPDAAVEATRIAMADAAYNRTGKRVGDMSALDDDVRTALEAALPYLLADKEPSSERIDDVAEESGILGDLGPGRIVTSGGWEIAPGYVKFPNGDRHVTAEWLEAELATAWAAGRAEGVAAVKAAVKTIHGINPESVPADEWCGADGRRWPCPTVAALTSIDGGAQ